MPNTGEPYFLPFPDGDMPPDGPAQLGDLAQVTSEKLREVENKAAHDLSAFVQRYQQEHDAQNQAIWNTGTNAGAALPRSEFDAYKATLASLSPVYLTVPIMSPPNQTGTLNKGKDWRTTVRNISGVNYVPDVVYSLIDPHGVPGVQGWLTEFEVTNFQVGGFDIRAQVTQDISIGGIPNIRLYTLGVVCFHPLARRNATFNTVD